MRAHRIEDMRFPCWKKYPSHTRRPTSSCTDPPRVKERKLADCIPGLAPPTFERTHSTCNNMTVADNRVA